MLKIFNSNLREVPEFVSAAGPWLRTESGAKYFDLWLGSGTLLFGHCTRPHQTYSPELLPDGGGILGSLVRLLSKSVEFQIGGLGLQTSGSGAVSRAIRLARAATGRVGVAVIGEFWHGSDDQLLFLADKAKITDGIPEAAQRDVYWYPTITEFLSSAELGNFAAVIVEPFQGANPADACLPVGGEDWRAELQKNGTLLILDEVITGFRERFGSCTISRQCSPDIVVFGKAAGGGYPVGLVLVQERVAKALSGKKIFWGGTFAASPTQLSYLESSLSALAELNYSEVADNLGDLNAYLREAINRSENPPSLITGKFFSRLTFTSPNQRRGGREFLPANSSGTVTEWAQSHGLYVSANGLVFSSVYNINAELASKGEAS